MKHPDYPDIDFKPAIARYDWDQTYDLLEFTHLPVGFGILNNYNIPSSPTIAIDRFTPYNYRWAENYSDFIYDFFHAFNYSPYNSIIERILTDEETWIRGVTMLPGFNYELSVYNVNDVYNVDLPKGKYQITMLIDNGFQFGLIKDVLTINQVCYYFELLTPQTIDINTIIKHYTQLDIHGDYYSDEPLRFCANSIVVSAFKDQEWIEYPLANLPNFLLYSDIAIYFDSIKQALFTYFTEINTNYGVIDNRYGKDTVVLQGCLNKKTEVTIDRFEVKLNSINLKNIFPPHYTNFCFLQRANNDKWGLGSTYPDLGMTPINNPSIISIDNSAFNDDIHKYVSYSLNRDFLSFISSEGVIYDGTYSVDIKTKLEILTNESGDIVAELVVVDETVPHLQRWELRNQLVLQSTNNVYPTIPNTDTEGNFELSSYSFFTFDLSEFYYAKKFHWGILPDFFIHAKTCQSEETFLYQGYEFTNQLYDTLLRTKGTIRSILKTIKYISDLNGITKVANEEIQTSWSNVIGEVVERGSSMHYPEGEIIPPYPYVTISTLEKTFYSMDDFKEGEIPDTEYLAYLQSLKLQYEEESKTW